MAREFLAILAAGAVAIGAGAASGATLSEARALYFQAKVGEARAAFSQIAQDPKASASDRSAAGFGLARIRWLIDGDAPGALAALAIAPGVGDDLCASVRMGARIQTEAGHPAAGAKRAAGKGPAGAGAGGADQLQVTAARAELDVAAAAPAGPARQSAARGGGPSAGGAAKDSRRLARG